MKDVGIIYVYLVYFTAILYILRLFGIFYGYLVHLFLFWYVVPRKKLATLSGSTYVILQQRLQSLLLTFYAEFFFKHYIHNI
jgi:hypothetical protein